MTTVNVNDPAAFSEALFEKMKQVNSGISELELYEFRYGLNDLVPKKGWGSVKLDDKKEIEKRLNNRDFYDGIHIKPKVGDRIVLDRQVVRLAQMLFVGLLTGEYEQDWVKSLFYFDIRGFYFLYRTRYFTENVLAHFGGKPFKQFEQKQKNFERQQDLGYKDFREANAEVDALFIESVKKIVAVRGTPILLAIAGATAAGKTEIVERLTVAFMEQGQKVASIELDNFFTDRDYREAKGINSEGKRAMHFELLKQSLENITHGKKISIPRYNTVFATSSHDLEGNLKPDGVPIEVEPADIIFIEGNFPFLLEEIIHLIDIKVVYLTDDPVRLKRKWKRDIDYRKKYDTSYLRNRFFKDQFIMAETAYLPQMEVCDITVDTSGAAIWVTPEIGKILGKKGTGGHMPGTDRLHTLGSFSEILFETMKRINVGIEALELYEFRYALENVTPEAGWESVELDKPDEIERLMVRREFYTGIQLRPRLGDRIVLDERIIRLTRMLFTGLIRGEYSEDWVNAHFYFDIRGFYFLPRTVYFTGEVLTHFGGKSYKQFEQKQKRFERFQDLGYKDFKEANSEIDQAFIGSVMKLVEARRTPTLITLAGPTAAGKTEITERLLNAFEQSGKKVTTIEMDNFLLDREYREDKPMGKESTHFELFVHSLEMILQGKKIEIPRYDFIFATSSHDLNGNLKAGCIPLKIEPADIIFMEGNFPFHMQELSSLIGIKSVYLTDDPIRLKRKWKRDVDYRKKYDPAYFCNRFFRTQFLRAEECYQPMMKGCDIVVDTTQAALWAAPDIIEILDRG